MPTCYAAHMHAILYQLLNLLRRYNFVTSFTIFTPSPLALSLQPRIATSCGAPPPSPACRWRIVKQWPFDMLGSNTVSSALAYDADGRKYRMDLVPLFKSLADLQTDRATNCRVNDFWGDFLIHINLPSIHEWSHRRIKHVLSERWRLLTGKPFPPLSSNSVDESIDVYAISDDEDRDSDMQDAVVSIFDELPDLSLSSVGWCLMHIDSCFLVRRRHVQLLLVRNDN